MPSSKAKTRTIHVSALTRVEGEGALHLSVEAGKVVDLRFEIFEPPRFFEALLRGRHATETPDITARICGICPVAYQMSAVHALEQLFQVPIDPAVRDSSVAVWPGPSPSRLPNGSAWARPSRKPATSARTEAPSRPYRRSWSPTKT